MSETVLLILSSALVLLGAAALVRALGVDDAIDSVVAVPVLAAAQIVVTLGAAGIVHRLERPTVLGLNVLVSVAAIALTRPRWTKPRTPTAFLRRAADTCRAEPFAAAVVVLALIALGWRLYLAAVLPSYGYDALSYHLPTVIEWLQSRSLGVSPLNTCCGYYPANGELLVSWIAVVTGSAALVDTAQIAAAIVGGCAVAGVARATGLPPAGQWSAGAIFVLTPVVLAQANVANVDVTFASFALAAFYLLLRAEQAASRRRIGLLALAGTAAGLALGTKPNGVSVVVAVAIPLAVAAARHHTSWRLLARHAAVFSAPMLILGAIWYARSWISTGNPFFPARVGVGDLTLFDGRRVLTAPPRELGAYPGILDPLVSWSRDLRFWTNSAYSAGQEVGGLGPLWSYLGVILLVAFALFAFRRRPAVFWYFVVPALVVFLAQPYHWWARFSVTLVAVGAVAVAWAATAPTGREWALRPRRWLRIGVVVLLAAGALIASIRVAPGARMLSLGLGDITAAATGGARSFGSLFMPDYAWIDELDSPARIAVDTRTVHITAPLAGDRFQHRLLALPKARSLDRFVAEDDVDYVVVRIGSPLERRLLRRTDLFEPVGSDQRRVRPFRVLR